MTKSVMTTEALSNDRRALFDKMVADPAHRMVASPASATAVAAYRHKGGNLIKNENLEQYDGTTAVVASEHLEPEEIEYERWRAEHWMKVRHPPPMVAHDPLFVLRNWW
jgi:ABC-type branched-subunit amino acid transport system substrate-binding protein